MDRPPPPPGMVWCPEHRTYERADDAIDFPVSATFLEHYYEQGLTLRKPALSPEVRRLVEEVETLKAQVAAVERQLAARKVAVRHHIAQPIAATPPPGQGGTVPGQRVKARGRKSKGEVELING